MRASGRNGSKPKLAEVLANVRFGPARFGRQRPTRAHSGQSSNVRNGSEAVCGEMLDQTTEIDLALAVPGACQLDNDAGRMRGHKYRHAAQELAAEHQPA